MYLHPYISTCGRGDGKLFSFFFSKPPFFFFPDFGSSNLIQRKGISSPTWFKHLESSWDVFETGRFQ